MKKKIFFILILFAFRGNAQTTEPAKWIPNGTVNAITQRGNIVYVGGQFTHVGKVMPNGLLLNSNTGLPNYNSSTPDGIVLAALTDMQGGFVIQGSFKHVGSVVRDGLARILSDGSLAAFNPALPSGPKFLLTTTADYVYVYVRGTSHVIYCIDYSGNVIWSKSTNNMVLGGVVAYNKILFVAGRFTVADGIPRNQIAAFDAESGAIHPWDAGSSLPAIFSKAQLAVSGSELYICYTPSIGKPTITAFDLNSEQLSPWSLTATNFKNILVHQGKLYATGNGISYTDVNGTHTREGLIIFDTQNKNVLSNPAGVALNNAQGLAVDNNAIYVSGYDFVDSNNVPIGDAIAFDASTLSVLPFKATIIQNLFYSYSDPSNSIPCIAANGNNVYVGGTFVGVLDQVRSNLFAYDVTTGNLAPLAHGFDGEITAVVSTASRLYVSGRFQQVDNLDRISGLASFDLPTGSLTDWSPVLDLDPYSSPWWGPLKLTGDDNSIYIAGAFYDVNNNSRNGVACFDADQNITSWSPSGLSGTEGIVKSGSTICVAGWTDTGNKILFFDATSGQELFPPVPYQNGTMYDMAVDNTTLYIGGGFNKVGGVARTGIASIDLTNGALNNNWNPSLTTGGVGGVVNNISAGGGTVYVAGNFLSVNTNPRLYIAALDAVSGQATDWNVTPNNLIYHTNAQQVNVIHYTPTSVYIGGWFDFLNNTLTPNFGVVSPDHSNVVTGTVFYDMNGNGVKDAGEKNAPNILMEVQPLNIFYPTDANGNYRAFTGIGNYTIKPEPNLHFNDCAISKNF